MKLIRNIHNFFSRSKSTPPILLNKFEEIETVIQSGEESTKSTKAHSKEEKVPESTFYEEEVLWWDSISENSPEDLSELLAGSQSLLTLIKKTELYNLVNKLDGFKIEDIQNPSEQFITIKWKSDYLDLGNRRNFLAKIKDFIIELESNGYGCQVIHDHRRVALSKNIGVKVNYFVKEEQAMDNNKEVTA